MAVQLRAVDHQHQLRVQISAADVQVVGAHDRQIIINEHRFGMYRVFVHQLENLHTGVQDPVFLVQVIRTAPGIGSPLHRIEDDLNLCPVRSVL